MKYYLIFGERLKDGYRLGSNLKKRLDKFVEVYKPADIVILTGGKIFRKEYLTIHSEAYVMEKYLIKKGIYRRDIIKESESLNTIQNIVNSIKIIISLKINNIILISSIWHLARVKVILNYYIKKYKLEDVFNYILLPVSDKISNKYLSRESKLLSKFKKSKEII